MTFRSCVSPLSLILGSWSNGALEGPPLEALAYRAEIETPSQPTGTDVEEFGRWISKTSARLCAAVARCFSERHPTNLHAGLWE